MMLKTDLKAYQARWAEVEATIERERRSTPIELRWQQLNAARALSIGLGLTPHNLWREHENSSPAGLI